VFRLDIHAIDEDGRTVVIENQLERTDHSHLGQCLVYASGLNASTVVWISSLFRDEFRSAFDWLNERIDLGVSSSGWRSTWWRSGTVGPEALSSRSCLAPTTGRRRESERRDRDDHPRLSHPLKRGSPGPLLGRTGQGHRSASGHP